MRCRVVKDGRDVRSDRVVSRTCRICDFLQNADWTAETSSIAVTNLLSGRIIILVVDAQRDENFG